MVKERINMMGKRTGLLGWFDRIRFNELLRQGIGLLLVAVCGHRNRIDRACARGGGPGLSYLCGRVHF